jgi:NADH-quinone oxidoreductase subunit L
MTFWGEERFHHVIEGEHVSEPPPAAVRFAADADDPAHIEAHDPDDDHDDEDEHHVLPHDFAPHESPWVMTVPLIVLAFLSTIGGLVGVPYAMSSLVGVKDANVFEQVLEPVVADVQTDSAIKARENAKAHSPEAVSTERWLALFSTVLAILGIAVGFALFRNNPLRRMPQILEQKWRIDEFYNGYIVDPITNLSRTVLWRGFDLGFIDGIVNGIGSFVKEAGSVARGIQVGFVRSYAAMIILGALAVIAYFVYYGLKLIG